MSDFKSERIKLVGGTHDGESMKVEIGVDEIQLPGQTEVRIGKTVEFYTERYRRVSPGTCVFAKVST